MSTAKQLDTLTEPQLPDDQGKENIRLVTKCLEIVVDRQQSESIEIWARRDEFANGFGDAIYIES